MAQLIEVIPGKLRLPPRRQKGAVAKRYFDQVRRFGGKADGMPVIQVTEGQDGELMINDGVTRAMRIHSLSPNSFVLVEIIDRRPHANFSRFKQVRDVGPPK